MGGAAVQQAHADLLAVAGGQGADPQVKEAPLIAPPDAAVLGEPALGDVQVRHDFQAGGHRGGELFRQLVQLFENPVLAQANQQAILLGFEVDVAGTAL